MISKLLREFKENAALPGACNTMNHHDASRLLIELSHQLSRFPPLDQMATGEMVSHRFGEAALEPLQDRLDHGRRRSTRKASPLGLTLFRSSERLQSSINAFLRNAAPEI